MCTHTYVPASSEFTKWTGDVLSPTELVAVTVNSNALFSAKPVTLYLYITSLILTCEKLVMTMSLNPSIPVHPMISNS